MKDSSKKYLFAEDELNAVIKDHINAKVEEIANAVGQFAFPFGRDTVDSFAIFIRSMKE